jgi:hypothetical protein
MRGRGRKEGASGPAGSWASRPERRKGGRKKILLIFFQIVFLNPFSKVFLNPFSIWIKTGHHNK